ncbi:MAG: NUDIX hydrolase [Actinomycetota bacterium]
MRDLRWPVSVKGVVTADRHVLLMLNERNEWELPGGRLEADETPERCVEREVLEEAGLVVTVDRIVDAWVYPIRPDHSVLIVTYRCVDLGAIPVITISDEHRSGRWVPLDACADAPMPSGYLRSIQAST